MLRIRFQFFEVQSTRNSLGTPKVTALRFENE